MPEYIHGDDLDIAEKEKLIKERDRAEKLHDLKMNLILFEQWRQSRIKDCSVAADGSTGGEDVEEL